MLESCGEMVLRVHVFGNPTHWVASIRLPS